MLSVWRSIALQLDNNSPIRLERLPAFNVSVGARKAATPITSLYPGKEKAPRSRPEGFEIRFLYDLIRRGPIRRKR
jgi:hypothetical protein